MENNSKISFGGVGFGSTLTIVFIVLKLLKVITWSWVWVLAPLWISAAFAILTLIIVAIIIKCCGD